MADEELELKYKEIPLSQGKVTIVDIKDFQYLNQFKWHGFQDPKNGIFYVARNIWKNNKRTTISIHREIMKSPKNMDVDHINGDGLDNRRCNLRICFHYQNMINRGKNINNTSGYKGVFWHKKIKKWQSRIVKKYKPIHLGYFNSKEEAALAYNKGAIKYFRGFAQLNEMGGL